MYIAVLARCHIVFMVVFVSMISGIKADSIIISTHATEPCSLPDILPISIKSNILNSFSPLYLTKSSSITNIPLYSPKSKNNSSQSAQNEHINQNENSVLYKDLESRTSLILECKTVNREQTLNWYGMVVVNDVYYHIKPIHTHPSYHSIEKLDQPVIPTFSVLKPIGTNTRIKRETKTTYYIDLLAVVDYKLYQSFYRQSNGTTVSERVAKAKTEIRKYFALYLDSVNIIYSKMTSDKIILQISLVGIYILETSEDATWIVSSPSGHLSTDTILNTFETWIKNNNIPEHDHAMLFTGYSISTTGSEAVAGRAVRYAMCKTGQPSLSVVVDNGGFQSVSTACHELGHSLGANHDEKGTGCLEEDQYIMTARINNITTNKLNQWLFSTCSITDIEKHINSINTESIGEDKICLTSKLTSQLDLPNVNNLQPGQVYDPDEQCRHIYGQTSFYSRGLVISSGVSDICLYMPCYKSDIKKYTPHIAARGTSCGNKKWCQAGQCVYSNSAPEKIESCVFGDKPSSLSIATSGVKQETTCSQLVRDQPRLCYVPAVLDHCCDSCSNIKSLVSGCEYGDKISDCRQSTCDQIDPTGFIWAKQCCKTCNLKSEFVCVDQGPDCQTTIKQGGSSCYDLKFAYKCCQSCQKLRQVDQKDCQYGNRYSTEECNENTKKGTANCDIHQYKVACCQTCFYNSTVNNSINTSTLNHISYLYYLLLITVYVM